MTLPSLLSMPDLARRKTLLAMLAGGGLIGCAGRETAPEFSYTLLDGSRHHSQSLLGRVVLLNFWATSCAPCVDEMPRLAALHRQFAARGLQTLAVAMRHDPPAAVSMFAQSRGLPFGVVIDLSGDIARRFGDLRVTPTSILLDKRGAVAWRHVGAPDFAALQQRVQRLLAEA